MTDNLVKSSILGFPRIGASRELKFAVEAYWNNSITVNELNEKTKTIRSLNLKQQALANIDYIPVNDFSLYDHVLDHSLLFNVIPNRFQQYSNNDKKLLADIDIYFGMARGIQQKQTNIQYEQDSDNNHSSSCCQQQSVYIDQPACEMKKWFDTNYHYIVPEISNSTKFELRNNSPVDYVNEAKLLGCNKTIRPVIIGPITYLLLSKRSDDERDVNFQPISVLNKLIPIYVQLFKRLADAGITKIQIDEPSLVTDNAGKYKNEYKHVYDYFYTELKSTGIQLLLTSYFESLDINNIEWIFKLPVYGIHIDVSGNDNTLLSQLLSSTYNNLLTSSSLVLSLGVVSGRNIWKNDYNKSINIIEEAINIIGPSRIIVSPSCSFIHVPYTIKSENKMSSEVLDLLSFAAEKIEAISTITSIINDKLSSSSKIITSPILQNLFDLNKLSIENKIKYRHQHINNDINNRINNITDELLHRKSKYAVRRELQHQRLNTPLFPTTTIGSFPQTAEIRSARSRYKKGLLSSHEYDAFLEKEIASCIKIQEELDIDVFVHGEAERNDMVEYFGLLLNGFVFSENGWVSSFGSRYVKPPIIVSDIYRTQAMTVRWTKYAQSLTKKPVKAMLTGPVTILNWSFVRDDISKDIQSKQIAFALREEIHELESIGTACIQVDEPALREGLPLQSSKWRAYLKWSVESFKLSTSVVNDNTQIHSHFCYSDFNDIIQDIIALDADVITIENSKSNDKLLSIFETTKYPNEIGPGVFDIHSPRVPTVDEIYNRIETMLKYIPKELLHVNPDCGLKTRKWEETKQQLQNLVAAAKKARATFGTK